MKNGKPMAHAFVEPSAINWKSVQLQPSVKQSSKAKVPQRRAPQLDLPRVKPECQQLSKSNPGISKYVLYCCQFYIHLQYISIHDIDNNIYPQDQTTPLSDILEPRIWGLGSFPLKKSKVSQFVNGDHDRRTPKCTEG